MALPKHYWYRNLYPDDPISQAYHLKYMRHKAQAKYRREEYELTLDEYMSIWLESPYLDNHGRTSSAHCMIRINEDLPWRLDNVEIVPRKSFLSEKAKLQGFGGV